MIDLCNCSWDEFAKRVESKTLFCFGSGNLAEWISSEISGVHITDRIIAFVDNDMRKTGSYVQLEGLQIPIISFENFVRQRTKNTVILVSSMYYSEMIDQMDDEPLLDGLECYIVPFLEEKTQLLKAEELAGEEECIPRIIHYCWFGKSDLPDDYKHYMESWQKFCPDYRIVRWDENNYDYEKTLYTKQAYEAGKYSFVSDYARLDVVYTYGGIYLDTDVEIIKNLDMLLKNRMFCGFEQGNLVNTGLGFGACKGFEHLKRMRDFYNELSFRNDDNSLNLTTCTKYQTEYLEKLGIQRNGKLQVVEGIRVYPRTVLAPLDFYGIQNHYSEFTYTIHHYAATWFQESREKLLQKNDLLRKRMG